MLSGWTKHKRWGTWHRFQRIDGRYRAYRSHCGLWLSWVEFERAGDVLHTTETAPQLRKCQKCVKHRRDYVAE